MADMKGSNPLRTRTGQIVRKLAQLYPDAHCALHYANPLQLLIATILSAQCTDARVNRITPGLFARYPDAAAFAARQGQLDPARRRQLIIDHAGIVDAVPAQIELDSRAAR